MSSLEPYVIGLDKVGYKDVKLVGGKAASLGEMLMADIPVPPGFVITTKAFRNGMTKSLKNEIKEAFEQLGSERVAVRSSAIAEDSSDASWAGQLDTVLNVSSSGLTKAVIHCWDSIKSDRAESYAEANHINADDQLVAVVIQVMVDSDISGVVFTANPITSNNDEIMIEAVYGLGEMLVQGTVIPETIIVDKQKSKISSRSNNKQNRKLVYKNGNNSEEVVPEELHTREILNSESVNNLSKLAKAIEDYYGSPQDIEWAIRGDNTYIVQARPITTLTSKNTVTEQKNTKKVDDYQLGEPEELFYWGPSRGTPIFTSDYIAAIEQFFDGLIKDPKLPNPPETLVLFHDDKVVWLINTKQFEAFTKGIFDTYFKSNKLTADIDKWKLSVEEVKQLKDEEFESCMIIAWNYTLFAEFALYGAQTELANKLKRFDIDTRHDLWAAFTEPDNSTFISRIDSELYEIKDPVEMSRRYPWIKNGYGGISKKSKEYFKNRLEILLSDPPTKQDFKNMRRQLTDKLKLTKSEIDALTFIRNLAEFMDYRKEWMMQSRVLIKRSFSNVKYGWYFGRNGIAFLNKKETDELWNRYINFKASTSSISGVVASNGNRHFIDGEVVVVLSPAHSVANDKILVIPATGPSYVPMMRKARAIITDHGGMMSHSAIVARELGLPCIVGTKKATKVLRDGDKVVLDLVKGSVSR